MHDFRVKETTEKRIIDAEIFIRLESVNKCVDIRKKFLTLIGEFMKYDSSSKSEIGTIFLRYSFNRVMLTKQFLLNSSMSYCQKWVT